MKAVQISQRAQHAPASPVRKLVPYAEAAKKKGIKVYHVNIGDPDFEAPKKILDSLQLIAKTVKRIPYTNSKGARSIMDSWIAYYKQIGIPITDQDLVVTSGGSEALIFAAAVTLDPGDEFIVFEPFYANYSAFGNLVSAKAVPVQLDPKTGYHLPTEKEIVAAITPKTKAIFFTNPNNPTGTVFTKKEVELIVKISREHYLFLVSDETYLGISFDGKKSPSVLHVANQEDKKRIIITDSVSKKLNMCGARIGVLVSYNPDVIDAAFRFAQGRLSSAYIEQEMIAPMLSHCLDYVAWLATQYQKRRDAFIQTLEEKLRIKIHRPEGAFYTMVQLPVDDVEKFAKWLLTDFSDNNETVMVAPGPGFYATPGKGKNEARVAYVLNEKDLARSAELLAIAVKKYNQR